MILFHLSITTRRHPYTSGSDALFFIGEKASRESLAFSALTSETQLR